MTAADFPTAARVTSARSDKHHQDNTTTNNTKTYQAMGAAASVDTALDTTAASPPPYATVEAALADGKTQEDIDAYLAATTKPATTSAPEAASHPSSSREQPSESLPAKKQALAWIRLPPEVSGHVHTFLHTPDLCHLLQCCTEFAKEELLSEDWEVLRSVRKGWEHIEEKRQTVLQRRGLFEHAVAVMTSYEETVAEMATFLTQASPVLCKLSCELDELMSCMETERQHAENQTGEELAATELLLARLHEEYGNARTKRTHLDNEIQKAGEKLTLIETFVRAVGGDKCQWYESIQTLAGNFADLRQQQLCLLAVRAEQINVRQKNVRQKNVRQNVRQNVQQHVQSGNTQESVPPPESRVVKDNEHAEAELHLGKLNKNIAYRRQRLFESEDRKMNVLGAMALKEPDARCIDTLVSIQRGVQENIERLQEEYIVQREIEESLHTVDGVHNAGDGDDDQGEKVGQQGLILYRWQRLGR